MIGREHRKPCYCKEQEEWEPQAAPEAATSSLRGGIADEAIHPALINHRLWIAARPAVARSEWVEIAHFCVGTPEKCDS